ncbi:MAG: prolipoprotein diacylglyceryl transferase [Gaiellales bacterium]
MSSLVATFPSPSTGTIEIGPLSIHMYGITLLVAIVCAIVVTGIRWTRRGGDWDLVLRAAVWGVAAGIVGARLYHVVTSYDQLPDEWYGPVAVWEGGLGIWGGILFGVIAGGIVVWRSGQSIALFADALAPGLLLAQAVGRWGNWWNQELFGEPTSLPWGLDIDAEHCPVEYLDLAAGCTEDFHPIFLYEFVFNLVGVGLLLLVERLVRIRPPGLFALYISWYTLGRLFEEQLRIDPSHEFLGQRVNFWVAAVLFVCSTVSFIWWQFFRKHRGPGPSASSLESPPEGPAMAVPKGRVRPPR